MAEETQAKLIVQLTNEHRCADKQCPYDLCYVDATGIHIHLTHLHLDNWASAWVCKHHFLIKSSPITQQAEVNGVDLENPPNQKMFDTTYRNTNDLALLTQRQQLQQGVQPSNNNSGSLGDTFCGLAELLVAVQRPPSSASSHNSSDAPAPAVNSKRLPSKISLEEFCDRYELSSAIEAKLQETDISGPHALKFFTDAILLDRNQGGFSHGELADVRDAEECWLDDNRWC